MDKFTVEDVGKNFFFFTGQQKHLRNEHRRSWFIGVGKQYFDGIDQFELDFMPLEKFKCWDEFQEMTEVAKQIIENEIKRVHGMSIKFA